MSYIGTNKVGGMHLGSTKIAKAYLGSNLVFDANGSLQPGQIPPNYTELAWVNGGGSSKIILPDSGIDFSFPFDLEMKANIVTFTGFINLLFTIQGACIGTTSARRAYNGAAYGNSVFSSNTDLLIVGKFRETATDSIFTVNGNDTGLTLIKDSSSTYSFKPTIFGLSGDNAYRSSFKLYYMKIYDTLGNVIHDFVPCLDNNGTPCVFDVVSMKKASFDNTTNVTYGTIS